MAGTFKKLRAFSSFETSDTVYATTVLKARMPNIIIMKLPANKYGYVKVAMTKLMQSLNSEANERKVIPGYKITQNVVDIVKKIDARSTMPLALIQTEPKFFPVKEFTFKQLHDHLTLKELWTESFFEKVIGVSVSEVKPTAKFRKAVIYMPDNMQASRKANLLATLKTVETELAAHKMEWLIDTGKIKIATLKSSVVGFYDVNNKDIVIDPAKKYSNEVIETVIHELAHKLWFEAMAAKEHKIVKEVYDKAKNAKIDNEELVKKIYTLPRNKHLAAGTYVFTPLDQGYAAIRYDPKTKMRGGAKAVTEKALIELGMPLATNWFPTRYSQKDHYEFFAEMFAEYIRGRLVGIQKAWMQRILKPHQKG